MLFRRAGAGLGAVASDDVVEDRPGEALTESAERAAEPLLDDVGTDAGLFGDVPGRELIENASDDDGAVEVGQIVDCAVDAAAELLFDDARHAVLGERSDQGPSGRGRFGKGGGASVMRLHAVTREAPQGLGHEVDEDGSDPALARAEVIQTGERSEPSLTHEICGLEIRSVPASAGVCGRRQEERRHPANELFQALAVSREGLAQMKRSLIVGGKLDVHDAGVSSWAATTAFATRPLRGSSLDAIFNPICPGVSEEARGRRERVAFFGMPANSPLGARR